MRNSRSQTLLIALALLGGGSATAAPLGTAFTYQGRLTDNGVLVNGLYELRFVMYDADSGGSVVGGPITNSAILVTNGLFTVAVDFGPGLFNGNARWLETAARTNGAAGTFLVLGPRQPTMPAPYALMALAASNLSGTLPAGQLSGTVANGQLANSSVTVSAGTGLSGGGTVALGGSTTLNNAGVLSITGNGDIIASPTNGAVALSTTATNTNVAGTIVRRGGGGSFSAGTVTLSGNLNLPTATTTAGIIYAGASLFVHGDANANFFAGVGAGNLSLSGNQNTGIGNNALASDTTGVGNTANGYLALSSNTEGSFNTANGGWALAINTNGSCNTANGRGALQANKSGNNNTASGFEALNFNTTGNDNTGDGYMALFNNTTGSNNTANGSWALADNVSGSFNAAFGYNALARNQSGANNTAVGEQALLNNTSGGNNTAFGGLALFQNTNGAANTALGYDALANNTSGVGNTACGSSALLNTSTGNYNTALGSGAGQYTSGSYNIVIDNPGSGPETGVIRIGTIATHNSTFIAGISGVTVSGGSAVYVNGTGQLGTATSSERFKQDIQAMGEASDVVLSLRPVAFRYRPEIDPEGIPQFGLVAEEVEKVAPELVLHDAQGLAQSVRYEQVNAMLLNEFLKQHHKVDEQKAQIEQLSAKAVRLDSLEKRLAELESLVQSLAGKN
jgi:hypothetical protein